MNILKLFTMSETELVNLLEHYETKISEFRLANIFTLIDLFCEKCSFSDYDYSIAKTENFKELVYHYFESNDVETSFLKAINGLTVNIVEKTGDNRHVEIGKSGKVIDSVTYEEIEGTPIKIGEHFYSTESANKLIENDVKFDPFTRETLSLSDVDDISGKIYSSSIKAMNPHLHYTGEKFNRLSSNKKCAKKIIFDDEKDYKQSTMFDRSFHEKHDKEDFLWHSYRPRSNFNFTPTFYESEENIQDPRFIQAQFETDPFVTPRSEFREFRMNNNT